MPTEPQPTTLFDVIHRAVAVCDQSGKDADLGELLQRFEDADEPIGDPAATRDRIYEEVGAIDPQAEDGAIQTAVAVAVYLCFRPELAGNDPLPLIKAALANEHHGEIPDEITAFLATSGISLD